MKLGAFFKLIAVKKDSIASLIKRRSVLILNLFAYDKQSVPPGLNPL